MRSAPLKEEIEKLIALQQLNTEMSQFDQKIADKQQELTEREKSILDKEAEANEFRETAQMHVQSQRDIKAAHEDAGTRIKERQNKMMQVQTSREHQALLKEIEDAKRMIKETEEQLLQAMEQAEQAEAKAVELENICNGEKELLAEETARVEGEVKKLNTRRKTVFNKRNKLSKTIHGSRMKRYDKLLKKRNGIAVVQVIDGVCQGCFMAIPPQQFNEIRKGEQMLSCPTCQRMLYYISPEGEDD
jgi:predicted  nucleic acid-binding Zn-ribbon protein